jgi:hypothetical protein
MKVGACAAVITIMITIASNEWVQTPARRAREEQARPRAHTLLQKSFRCVALRSRCGGSVTSQGCPRHLPAGHLLAYINKRRCCTAYPARGHTVNCRCLPACLPRATYNY